MHQRQHLEFLFGFSDGGFDILDLRVWNWFLNYWI